MPGVPPTDSRMTESKEAKAAIIRIYERIIELDQQAQEIIKKEKPIADRRTLGAIRDDSRQRRAHLERSITWLKEDK